MHQDLKNADELHYVPSEGEPLQGYIDLGDGTMAMRAFVAHYYGDGWANLLVFDERGVPVSRERVKVVRVGGEVAPAYPPEELPKGYGRRKDLPVIITQGGGGPGEPDQ